MKNLLLFFFLIIIVSCNKKAKKTIIKIPKVKNETKKIDSVKVLLKRKEGEPVKEFQTLVKDIEKDDWFSDTLRLKKVNLYPPLIKGTLKQFNNRPFYKINFNDTRLKTSFDYNQNNRGAFDKFSDSLDIKLVEKVKTIWGYFYRGKKVDYTIEDGVIEQWEYENEEIAGKAFVEIRDFAVISYFNTRPYLFRKENFVFILHTRAMYFSYGQEKIYKQFEGSFTTIKQIHN